MPTPMLPVPLEQGDRIRIRLVGDPEWSYARVALASPISADSTQSVGLFLESPVRSGSGILIGALPLTVNYSAETTTSLLGDQYEIEVRA